MKWVIYEIRNLKTKKSYVGCTKNLKRRLAVHRCSKTEAVQGKYRVLKLAETDSKEVASDLEKFFVAKKKTLEPQGYNRRDGGFSGYEHLPSTLAKLSVQAKLRPSPFRREKTPEQIRKQSLSLKRFWKENGHPWMGRKHSTATKKKMKGQGLGHKRWLGKKHPKETKRKMSLAKKGCVPWNKGVPCSPETRRKISEANSR